ncbi:sugar ABC transporter ATP-binding protein (plasmid) [Azospirillum argentinense]|uniref:Sugar ABC transporter ATP-binding protein n=1 Tax=Azospirillum argentinense TaxID=2970906 RepID=A0A4D8PTE1_9PROT|nr:sugar ABC transporter ATP-binding protein [Azospirillum argentinense]QCO00088.1 sugar ABC transporter ATP-binding protein [Azospirillum argentinense]
MRDSAPLLRLTAISKSFPGVRALDGVDLTVGAGEVVALIGENGAGKSTLMKILNGIYQPDGGEIALDGAPVSFSTPHAALSRGVSMVHQEPKLCLALSVTENVLIGRLPRGRFGAIDWRAAHERTRELLQRVGMRVEPTTPTERLSIAERQQLQIAKALASDSRLIVLDEPTASLTPVEVDVLFGIVRDLQAVGVSFIYISHHLEEIFRIAQSVSVLKDGRKVADRKVAETTKEELLSLMVGRDLGNRFPAKDRRPGAPALEVRNLSGRGFRDVSFRAHKGEVVGIAGLVGAGRTELARAIFGADPIKGGEVLVDGKPVKIRNPADAIGLGVAYIAEDRRDGLFMPLPVRENITVVAPEAIATNGVIRERTQKSIALDYIKRLNIRTPSGEQQIRFLSGGNQQKCILARWIIKGVQTIIFDEPTRGIDVGAKTEIYRLIDQLASEGKAVILISSELPEILGMCDRVLVMERGRLNGEVDGHEATEENLLALALPTNTPSHELQP